MQRPLERELKVPETADGEAICRPKRCLQNNLGLPTQVIGQGTIYLVRGCLESRLGVLLGYRSLGIGITGREVVFEEVVFLAMDSWANLYSGRNWH
jgi:hypothetical protein